MTFLLMAVEAKVHHRGPHDLSRECSYIMRHIVAGCGAKEALRAGHRQTKLDQRLRLELEFSRTRATRTGLGLVLYTE